MENKQIAGITFTDKGPKISYNHKESAIKAAQSMEKKNGVHYSVYKCIYCDGYHIGRNRIINKHI